MKKLTLILLTGMMLFSCMACGGRNEQNQNSQDKNTQNNNSGTQLKITDANEILTKVWDEFEDEDSDGDMYNDKFAVIGGHFEDAVDNKPGKYDITKTEDLEFALLVPKESIKDIDDAASMVHMMNSNTFTAGAFHLTDASKTSEFVNALKERVVGNQWMCGFPEKLLIVTVSDDYVVSAFGNANTLKTFQNVLLEQYKGSAKVVVDETSQ